MARDMPLSRAVVETVFRKFDSFQENVNIDAILTLEFLFRFTLSSAATRSFYIMRISEDILHNKTKHLTWKSKAVSCNTKYEVLSDNTKILISDVLVVRSITAAVWNWSRSLRRFFKAFEKSWKLNHFLISIRTTLCLKKN